MIGRQVTDRARAGVVIAFILLIQEENPMKHPVSAIFLLIALLLPAAPVQAADEIVEKTYCTQGIAYESIDALKLDLLNNAKKAVIDELFGEFIVASTAVENFVVTKDQIQTSSLGFVRVEGNTKFHNGEDFADVCVTIAGYVTAEDRAKFVPEPLDNKYCDADDDMTTSQLIAYVKDETIIQALIEYDPKLKAADKDSLLQLVQKVTYLESGFISDTQTYCATFEGEVVPVEVMAFLGTDSIEEEAKASVLSEGLVAYYSFDNEDANDSSENGNHGTLYGDPQTVSGIRELALQFGDYNNPDHIIVANSNSLSSVDNFTYSLWFNLLEHTSQDGNGGVVSQFGAQTLLGKSGDRTGIFLYVQRSTSDGLWYPKVANGGCDLQGGGCGSGQVIMETESGMGVNLDEWHMLTVTHDDRHVRLYLDGVLQHELATERFLLDTTMATRPIYMGWELGGTNEANMWYPLTGMLDEVRIYDRALNEAEIQTLYEQDAPNTVVQR